MTHRALVDQFRRLLLVLPVEAAAALLFYVVFWKTTSFRRPRLSTVAVSTAELCETKLRRRYNGYQVVGNWRLPLNPLVGSNLMAFEQFAERARKVVDLASAEDAQLGDSSVDTVHLLVGMLREGSGVAGSVLAGFEIDVDSVLEANKSIESEPDAALPEVESSCVAEAKWLGHNYVGTEHLILGVCSLSDCKAVRLLSSIGKSPDELCQEVLNLLGHGEEWNRWLTDHPGMTESQ